MSIIHDPHHSSLQSKCFLMHVQPIYFSLFIEGFLSVGIELAPKPYSKGAQKIASAYRHVGSANSQ